MNAEEVGRAAGLIAGLWTGAIRLDHLPLSCQPCSVAEALAIQEAAIAKIGEPVVGWKTATLPDGQVAWGAILASRLWSSPARVPATLVPLLGVETEIAFRFTHDLPPRATDYSRAELEAAVIAFLAIEIVDSRFNSYRDAPLLDRTADFMSNGGCVTGRTCEDWHTQDLAVRNARLVIDGQTVVEGPATHPAGHPLLPALALVNVLRRSSGIRAGQIVTTGTYTGLRFAKPGDRVTASLNGFDTADVVFTP